ncbi:DNA or RNA helicase of superfamily II [Pseudomonas stutzeri]|uniref:cysteine-rich CWC family protein n=1 Tax=Stutzerimonas stutzeri TaxID=316 RepID=UPI00190CE5D3|nr:cysteine-rich CWC family protein [Stutzerimonas stutzeri]MBK3866772.1 DNA or RNA helicase of superfamily II [Stutzerimonas stutzeri]
MSEPVDPSCCPLCGQPNQCARCTPDASQPCWCLEAKIAQAVLERIPATLRNQACLCSRCARGEPATKP